MQVIISGTRWNQVGSKEEPRLADEKLFPEPIVVEVESFQSQQVSLEIPEWGLEEIIIMKTGVGFIGKEFKKFYGENPGLAVRRRGHGGGDLGERGLVIKPRNRGNRTEIHKLPHVFFDDKRTSMIQISGNGIELRFSY